MITKQQGDKLKYLIDRFADSKCEYDYCVSREEGGDFILAYEELIYNKSVLYGFIEGLTNDNQCQN